MRLMRLCAWNTIGTRNIVLPLSLICCFVSLPFPVCAAGRIDTSIVEAPWPGMSEREVEVGRDAVHWRAARTSSEIYAGVKFTVPASLDIVWQETTQYQDIKQIVPGVRSVEVLEDREDYQEIELVIKVLWHTLHMRFQLERDPRRATRFSLLSPELGEYKGIMTTRALGKDAVEVDLATWLKPAVPVSTRLILIAQRMVLLNSVEKFIETCRVLAAVETDS